MSNFFRPAVILFLAFFVLIGIPLVGPAHAQTQQPAQSSLALALRVPEDVAAPPADAIKSKSGLATKVVQAGTGTERPSPFDRVVVNYTGWTPDGKMFDSTYARGKPSTLPMTGILPGWTEGLQLMVVGEKRRMWIPEKLAFKGASGMPKGMVVFDVALIDIIAGPRTPPDVAEPPVDAMKSGSGLCWKVLKEGTGKEHPGPSSAVIVNYSGWTADGKMFDSSVSRGKPAELRLNQVIQGWTEGVQLMTAGEVRRFWIPQDLAYGGEAGKPVGMLVFDIELISFKR